MKQFVALFIIASCFVNMASAQTTTNWAEKVVGKWHYEGTEEFGVVSAPDSTHKKDWLQFNADGTFSASEKGKAIKGTYAIDGNAKTMTTKDSAGKSKLYYLKKSDPGILMLETQTPDLIRTRHKYTAMK